LASRPPQLKTGQGKPSPVEARPRRSALLGVDRTAIEGIAGGVALGIAAALGPDGSGFRSAKAFSSWLGRCPNQKITAGKVKSRKTRPGAHRVATALGLAATRLLRSPTALGGFGRRLRSRRGAPKAITGVAHQLAVWVDRLLQQGEASVKRGAEEYQAQDQDRRLAALRRSASELGFRLEPLPAQEPGSGSGNRGMTQTTSPGEGDVLRLDGTCSAKVNSSGTRKFLGSMGLVEVRP
jgi:hypothetical protein